MGNQNASFDDMSALGTSQNSSSSTIESKPKSTSNTTSSSEASPITGFSLIQANTNKNLQEISTGNAISTTTHKLNIQANVVSGFKGSIHFSLTEHINQNTTDDTAPYSLFGDDERGNYYFGSGLPKGDYTLVAMPNIGDSKTIKFTIK
jgi:hypothetical protein